MYQIIAALIGYACGSIPFGLLLTRAAGLGDVRKIGSGNIGATNVLRTGNKKIALLTLLCDGLKGTVPVLIAAHFWGWPVAVYAAFGAMLGHIFPVWLGFKGGKGVATFVGVLFGLYWPLGIVFAVLWLALAFTFKYSSLAALGASVVLPFVAIYFDREALAFPIAVLVALIWFMHRANIKRLLGGTESKINLSSKK
jgi:acyl phosphate:glycerol-3-phosphate acyltransferase